jgi:hypothetical protein
MRMKSQERAEIRRGGERGSTLYIVAGTLVVLLGVAALAIDLGSLYVARNESQRAADSAALAGAKVFVESGCVTNGDCTSVEAAASALAAKVAAQNLVEGQPVTINAVTFTETPQNPQITVQVQSATLHVYFAGAVGVKSGPVITATATAEAYNPSGESGGPEYCTSCVRPWLIPNCDPGTAGKAPGCGGQTYLLDPTRSYGVENPGCFPNGVVGEFLPIAIESDQPHFGVVDDGTGLSGYQSSITTCNTGQMTCGTSVSILPLETKLAYTGPGVNALLHIASGNVGLNQGQDWIDTSVCPPQIHAGAQNPLVLQGVVTQDAIITTSDSIVTAYLYDAGPDLTKVSSLTVSGFVQLFVTQQDAKGDVGGVILGLAGCSRSNQSCRSGSIKGPTMIPVRLINRAAA